MLFPSARCGKLAAGRHRDDRPPVRPQRSCRFEAASGTPPPRLRAPASGKVISQGPRSVSAASERPQAIFLAFHCLSRFSPLSAKRFVGALPQFPEILDVVAFSFGGRSRRSAECERRRCVAKKRSGLRPSSIPLSLSKPLRSAFSVSRVSRYSPRISSCRRKSFRGRCPSAFPASGSTRFSCPARVRQMRCFLPLRGT